MPHASSRGRMIITGTIAAMPLGIFAGLLAEAGPATDPRIRTGAAVGIIACILGAGISLCLIAIYASAADQRRDLQEHHRECDALAARREIRDLVALYRRGLAREIRQRHRQLADWPALEPVGKDGTGPQPIRPR